jgi:hypothetical protein
MNQFSGTLQIPLSPDSDKSKAASGTHSIKFYTLVGAITSTDKLSKLLLSEIIFQKYY